MIDKKDPSENNVVDFSQRKRVLRGAKKKSEQIYQGKWKSSKWFVFIQLIVLLALLAFMLKQC